MLNRYQSPYRNSAHQLFVTPSKHIFVLKDGRIKWQQKSMEVSLKDAGSGGREQIVHYILADHYSSAFFAEAHTSNAFPGAVEFLHRAWAHKPDFFFWGVPDALIVPTAVDVTFPELTPFLARLGVENLAPSSGFAAGVHHVRNWEKDVANALSMHEYFEKKLCMWTDLPALVRKELIHANGRTLPRDNSKRSRMQVWQQGNPSDPPLRAPPHETAPLAAGS